MKFPKGTREEFLEDMQPEFAYASLRTELTKYQERFVRRYCSQFTTPTVVCYCHYCPEGLLQGGVDGRHLADLVFSVRKEEVCRFFLKQCAYLI